MILTDSMGWQKTKCRKISLILLHFFRSSSGKSRKKMNFHPIRFQEIKNTLLEAIKKTRGQLVPPSVWKNLMSLTFWFSESALGRLWRRIFRTAFGRFWVWKWQNCQSTKWMVFDCSSDWNTIVDTRNSIYSTSAQLLTVLQGQNTPYARNIG